MPNAPTPVPTPTPSAQPNIQFSVDYTYIRAGECVNFYWQVENVTAVFFYAQGEQQAGVGGIDQRSRCPTSTTTFELRVVQRDNSQVVRQITVGVDSGQTPQIRRFDINPNGQIILRQCVAVSWEVSGQVNYVRLRRNGESLWDGAPLMGSLQDCPIEPGVADYLHRSPRQWWHRSHPPCTDGCQSIIALWIGRPTHYQVTSIVTARWKGAQRPGGTENRLSERNSNRFDVRSQRAA
ncbi:MAG: hypothetical protein R2932_06800 [Caldilineaceae bacterium]